MSTSTPPPTTSMREPKREPSRPPSRRPARESPPVTTPMTALGYQMPTPRMARLRPMARASRLVATLRLTSVQPLDISARTRDGSGCRPERIIRAPTQTSRPNATQWSMTVTWWATRLPAYQPSTGIRNWKSPK
jgi:hypothetical protein